MKQRNITIHYKVTYLCDVKEIGKWLIFSRPQKF